MCNLRFLAAAGLLAVALSGCGGGGDGADREVGPSGQLHPASANVEVREYAQNGELLQISTPTDSEGRFSFKRPLTGARVVTLATDTARHVPDEWSARVVSSGQSLHLTPLSTLLEQLDRHASSPSEAWARLRPTLSAACGPEAAQYLEAAPDEQSAEHWLQTALWAYVRALKDVGNVPASDWAERLAEHRSLLARMCDVSRTVNGADWARTLAVQVPALASKTALAGRDLVPWVRARTLKSVLRLLGTSAAVLTYPELRSALEPRLQAWQGRELPISMQLAEQLGQTITKTAQLGQWDPAAGDFPASLGLPSLSDSGEIVTTLEAEIDSDSVASSVWRAANVGNSDRKVLLSVNGTPLFDRSTLLSAILRVPMVNAQEALHLRAWRFVKRWSDGAVPLTGGSFQHQADLYLRSLGQGRCDDDASALREIWAWLGFPARVWSLGGHIVPEVYANGRWEMYDAHYGVYFRTREGAVAGVADLQRDSELVLSPAEVNDPSWWRDVAEIAQLYANADDNVVMAWYSRDPDQPMGHWLTVPAGGHLEVSGQADYTFPSISSIYPDAHVRAALVRLWFPPGYSGPLMDLPLILADAAGSGVVSALGQDFAVTTAGIRPQLQAYYGTDPDVGVTQVQIRQVGPGGLTLTLLLNSAYFSADQQSHTVAIAGVSNREFKLVAPSGTVMR